jgi:hypothetical protein
MKYAAIAALLGLVSPLKLKDSPDCPTSREVFSYNERHPAAAGLSQISSCVRAGVMGVPCEPQSLFASGMNGDEDLGMDIKMKGEKYHIGQKTFATGMNGDEDLGMDIKMKGEKYHISQQPADEKLFASGMNGDEDLGMDIKMKGEKYHIA